ncbi:MAG: hypothetical protein GXP46_12535 [Deferribacteres bacterium]|nr:hypothetical protein [Deferribacteres bacterium]
MRLFIALVFLISSVVTLPQVSLAQKATTVDELAAMYNIDTCIDCHEDTHDEWKNSWHSQTISDSRVVRTWRTFILRGLDKSDQTTRKDLSMCLRCHLPQVKDATDGLVEKIADLIVTAADAKSKAKRESAKKELSKLNVNCLICHNLKGAPDGNPQAKTIYGPRGSTDTPHKEEIGFETVKSDVIKTSQFCARCHNGCQGLPLGVCSSVVTSYNEHYVKNGGKKTCQDCHMPGDETKSHKFPGIFDVDFAKTAVDIEIVASKSRYIYHLENKIVPAIGMRVKVTNTGGHEWPHG